ncbi:MAG: peptidoglycan-binding protein, partial [Patescibacteria group bacterium]
QSMPTTLNVNLKYGDTGEGVKLLQTWLAKDTAIYPTGVANGTFGPATKAAVIKFQEKYKAEILTPAGLANGTGLVGASTRAKLNSLYGGQ